MKRNKDSVDGQQLVADFQTAFIETVVSNSAQFEAENSEDELLQHLSSWSSGGYLKPGAINPNGQDDVSRASLDAHIKKIQARQVDDLKIAHLRSLSEHDQELYVGRKVMVEVKHAATSPLEVVWHSPQTGYRSNSLKKKRLTGIIDSLDLDKNLLILRPNRVFRLINSDLVAYIVYVIDPETAEPMVELFFA